MSDVGHIVEPPTNKYNRIGALGKEYTDGGTVN
jgi:hypothetical protein